MLVNRGSCFVVMLIIVNAEKMEEEEEDEEERKILHPLWLFKKPEKKESRNLDMRK